MKKARKINGGRNKTAAFVGVAAVVASAAFGSFATLGGNASAQEGGAIPAAVEAERSGKATLGVETSELDFYNDFNGARGGTGEQVARSAGTGEVDGTAQRRQTAETGSVGQRTQTAEVGSVGQRTQTAEVGNVGQSAQTAEVGSVGQRTQTAEIGSVGQRARAAEVKSVGQKAQAAEIGEVAQTTTNAGNLTEEIEFDGGDDKSNFWTQGPSGWFGPEGAATSLKTLLTFSILAVAPAILLATTSFVRISVVLSLLRQGIGAGQVPSNQTIAALAVFLSLLIMTPVWSEIYETAVVPYSEGQISNAEAFQRGQAPIRTFLWRQIEKTGNVETIRVFTRFIPGKENPEFYEDVPWRALAPAFLLSELKTAFLIGFQILIPFLIIDVVVSSVLVSTGMMMLPPTVVSLPFKLALFVLSDGWTLVVKSLLESFAWSGAAG